MTREAAVSYALIGTYDGTTDVDVPLSTSYKPVKKSFAGLGDNPGNNFAAALDNAINNGVTESLSKAFGELTAQSRKYVWIAGGLFLAGAIVGTAVVLWRRRKG